MRLSIEAFSSAFAQKKLSSISLRTSLPLLFIAIPSFPSIDTDLKSSAHFKSLYVVKQKCTTEAPFKFWGYLKRLGIPRRIFITWYKKYATGGLNALRETPYRRQTTWNRIPDNIRQVVVGLSLEHPKLTPGELSVLLLKESQIFVSESSLYSILHKRGLLERIEHDFVLAADEFHHKTEFANDMLQTDFTYFKVKGWGWY